MKNKEKASTQLSLLEVDVRDAGTIAFEMENLQNRIATCLRLFDEVVFLLNIDTHRLIDDARFTYATTPSALREALSNRNNHLSLVEHQQLDHMLTQALKDMAIDRLTNLRDSMHAMDKTLKPSASIE